MASAIVSMSTRPQSCGICWVVYQNLRWQQTRTFAKRQQMFGTTYWGIAAASIIAERELCEVEREDFPAASFNTSTELQNKVFGFLFDGGVENDTKALGFELFAERPCLWSRVFLVCFIDWACDAARYLVRELEDPNFYAPEEDLCGWTQERLHTIYTARLSTLLSMHRYIHGVDDVSFHSKVNLGNCPVDYSKLHIIMALVKEHWPSKLHIRNHVRGKLTRMHETDGRFLLCGVDSDVDEFAAHINKALEQQQLAQFITDQVVAEAIKIESDRKKRRKLHDASEMHTM